MLHNKKSGDYMFSANNVHRKSGVFFRISITVLCLVLLVVLLYFVVTRTSGNGIETGFAVSEDKSREDLASGNEDVLLENQELMDGLDINAEEGMQDDSAVNSDANAERSNLESTRSAVDSVIALSMKSASDDLVGVASSVRDLDLYIKNLGRDEVTVPWQRLLSCVYDGCTGKDFVNLIDALVVTDLDDLRNKAIHSLIETYNYWDGRNIVLFSKSLPQTNELIVSGFNTDIIAKWNEVIKCNGKCNDFNALVYQLIGMINK